MEVSSIDYAQQVGRHESSQRFSWIQAARVPLARSPREHQHSGPSRAHVTIKNTTEIYRPNYDTDYILFSGWVKEAVGGFNGSDDDFGSKSVKVFLREINSTPKGINLNFQNKVGIRCNVKRIR